jgi:hypothetical protein
MTEQHKCCGKVGNGFSFFRCDRNAKYEHLGKWYCKTHHPPTLLEKREARNAEWNKEFSARQLAIKEAQAAKDEAARRAALYPELLEALRVFVSCSLPVSTEIDERGHRWTEAHLDQALPIARAAIARAEGEKT